MKRKIVVSLIIVAVLSLSQYKVLLTGYARFFTIDNATPGMEATIDILSGNWRSRVPKALELSTTGYGTRLLLTTEAQWNSKIAHLIKHDVQVLQSIAKFLNIQVKFETVPSLKGGATSTFDEAYDLLAFCNKENLMHIIVVTDSFHTRRAFLAFKKVFKGSNIKVEVSAAYNEIFNEENWWFSDLGILSYVSEPIKFVAYLLYEQNVPFIKND